MADNDLLINIVASDNSASRQIRALQSSIIRLVGAVASLAAALKTVAFPIAETIEFEKQLINISKTTDITGESLNQMGLALRDLAVATGVPADELAKIAAAAGQLGLRGQEGILAFTETVAKFGTTVGIAVDEASVSLAKLTNIFKIPITQSEKLAAVLNELSNTSTATGEQLIDVIRRVGDAGGLLKFADAAAFAAQAIDLGQTEEVAGTSITKLFASASEKAKEFGKAVGLSAEEFTQLLNTDAVAAIKLVGTELSKLDRVAQASALKDLFGGGRQGAFGQKFLQDAANGFEILNKHLKDANEQFILGTSSIEEYQRVSESTARQIEILGARFKELALEAGDELLPVVKDTIKGLQDFFRDEAVAGRVKQFAELVRDAARSLIDFVKVLTNSQDTLQAIARAFEVLIGFGIARVFAGMATSAALFVTRIVLLKDVIGGVEAGVISLKTAFGTLLQGGGIAGVAKEIEKAKVAAEGTATAIKAASATKTGVAATVSTAAAAQTEAVSAAQANVNRLVQQQEVIEKQIIADQAAVIAAKRQLAGVEAQILTKTIEQMQARNVNQRSIENAITLEQRALQQGITRRNADKAALAAARERVAVTESILVLDANILAEERKQLATAEGIVAAQVAAAAAKQKELAASAVSTGGQIAGAFGKGANALKAFGGTILRFLSGPWGQLLLTFGAFSGVIASMFDGFEDKLNGQVAKTVEATSRRLQKIRADIEAFNAEQKNLTDKGKVKIEVEADLDTFKKQLNDAVQRLVSAPPEVPIAVRAQNQDNSKQADAIRGAFEKEDQRARVLAATLQQQEQVTAELEKQKELLQAQQLGNSNLAEGTAKRVADLQKQADALPDTIKKLRESVRAAERDTDRFIATMEEALSQLAPNVSKQDVAVIRQIGNLNKLVATLNDVRKRIAEINARQGGDQSKRTPDDIAADAATLQVLTIQEADLRDKTEKLKEDVKNIGGSTTARLGDIIPLLTQVQEGTTELSVNGQALLEALDKRVENLPANLETWIGKLVDARARVRELGLVSKVFDDFKKKINLTTDAARSLFNNLDSATRSTRTSIQSFVDTITKIPERRAVELKLQFNQEESDKAIDRAIERIRQGLQSEIDGLDTGSPQATELTRIANDRIQALEQQKKDNEAVQEAAKLQRAFNDALDDANDLLKQRDALQQAIANQEVVTAGGIQKQQENFERVQLLNKQLEEVVDKAKDAGQALINFGGTISNDVFLPDAGRQQIVDSEKAVDVAARVKQLSEETISARAGLITAANQAADKLDEGVKDLGVNFTAASAQALQDFTDIAKQIGLGKDQLEAITKALDLIPTKTKAVADAFQEAVNSAGATPITFDVQSVVNTVNSAVDATKTQLAQKISETVISSVVNGAAAALPASGQKIVLEAQIKDLQAAVKAAQEQENPTAEIRAQVKLDDAQAQLQRLQEQIETNAKNAIQNTFSTVTSLTESDVSRVIQDAVTQFTQNLDFSKLTAKQVRAVGDTFLNAIKEIPDDKKSVDASLVLSSDQVQSALDDLSKQGLTLAVNIVPNAEGGGEGGRFTARADGGLISGPGGSREDKIPAWLSNGEFVMDARTTRRFGPGFFRYLQRVAREGLDIELPRFAVGGLVGSIGGDSAVDSNPTARDIVTVNLNIGSEQVELAGDREQVRRLTRALKNIGRGGAR